MAIDFLRMLQDFKARGVSAAEVARRLGVHPNTLGNWKKEVGAPRVDEAFRFIMLYCEVVKPTDAQTFVSTHTYKLVVTRSM